VRKPEGKIILERPRHRYDGKRKINFQEIE
jgi:hypothetical protein